MAGHAAGRVAIENDPFQPARSVRNWHEWWLYQSRPDLPLPALCSSHCTPGGCCAGEGRVGVAAGAHPLPSGSSLARATYSALHVPSCCHFTRCSFSGELLLAPEFARFPLTSALRASPLIISSLSEAYCARNLYCGQRRGPVSGFRSAHITRVPALLSERGRSEQAPPIWFQDIA